MSAPFFAVESGRWPRVLARLRLLGALEEDEVRTDLRYLENEAHVFLTTKGKRGATFPGRERLMQRWGWSDRQVKKILAADDWHDPNKGLKGADLRQSFKGAHGSRPNECPASDPMTDPACDPTTQPANADNRSEMSSERPNDRPSLRPNKCPSRVRLSEPRSNHDNHESGPADAAPPTLLVLPSPTPKPAKPPKASKREPHPAHRRLVEAWFRVYEAERKQSYPTLTGREAKAIATLADDYVSRADPERTDTDMQRIGAAFRQFQRKPAHAYPAGHTIAAFCVDPAQWFSTDHRARDATTRRPIGLDLHAAAEALLGDDPPTSRPDFIDVPCEVLP